MNIEQSTIGIELETFIPAAVVSDGRVIIGAYHNGTPVPSIPGWKAEHDGSIRPTRGHRACEFVSGVFTGSQGLAELAAGVRAIKALGAKVNASCGFHVHIGFDKSNVEALRKLVSIVAAHEKAVFAATGTRSRERGMYCAPIQRYGDADRASTIAGRDRYHILNIATRGNTVEFRAGAGTLNVAKIVATVRLYIGMVEMALTLTRKAKWTPATPVESSPMHRDGIGQTAVNRLFYRLGWTRGQSKRVYGNLIAPGLPSLKSSKNIVMKMAKQYDAQ